MLDQTQTQTQRRAPIGSPFERAIPVAAGHIDCTHLDSMSTRIAHQLRRCIKAHRLAVDECRTKCGRLVMFQPGGRVHEESEARSVRLRKSVFTEPEYLIENLMRKALGIPSLMHAIDQLA